MKKPIYFSLFIALAAALSVFSSCDKDEGKLPDLNFKSGGNYVSGDATLGKDSTVTFGVDAKKTEDKDVLKSFNISVNYDGKGDSTIYNETLSGSSGDNYSHDQQVKTRSIAGSEKYTFSVTNRDGITNRRSITLTVQ